MKKILILLSIMFCAAISNLSNAGRLEGSGSMKLTLKPDQIKIYNVNLIGNELTHVQCSGVGGEVDYYLYDPNGKLIDYDKELGSNCNIKVNIINSGKYYLKVDNLSDDESASIKIIIN